MTPQQGLTLIQYWSTDFFQHCSFWIVFGAWSVDFWTGTAVAVKSKVWNSQTAEHGLRKLFTKWLPLLVIEYLARKSGTDQGLALGVSVVTYCTYTNLGSALENVGLIANDQTLTIMGRSLQMRATDKAKKEAAKTLPDVPSEVPKGNGNETANGGTS